MHFMMHFLKIPIPQIGNGSGEYLFDMKKPLAIVLPMPVKPVKQGDCLKHCCMAR
jgi:hypothetical protein